MSDHQEQLHEELEHIRVALDQMASDARQLASEARGPSPRAPSTGPAPSDRNIQVIVEIEARAVTVERLSMVSERQGWTFGETLEYALDALELAMAKTATKPERPLAPAPAATVVTLMLTRIACPNCGHIGAANAASLPRVLICSQCSHGAFIKSGRPAASPSVARDEQAALRAAWERYEATGEPTAPWP